MKKILLLCNAGMSTSILVKKMRDSAEKNNISVLINAVGLDLFKEKLSEYDVFLLGPQVRFKQKEFQDIANNLNKKVEIINTVDYGAMRGDKVLEFALKHI